MRTRLRGIFKILKWAAIVFFTLLIVLLIAINIPALHDYALSKAVVWFNKKTNSELSVGDIDLRLPRYVELQDLELKDPAGNEIISAKKIEVELSWHYLLNNKIELDRVVLEEVRGSAVLDKNESWNFQFIIDVFASEDSPQLDTTASTGASWDFGIDYAEILNSDVAYIDRNTQDSIHFQIGTLQVDMDDFSVINQSYLVDELLLEHTIGMIQVGSRTEENTETTSEASEIEIQLALNEALLKQNQITYMPAGTGEKYFADVGTLSLETKSINLNDLDFKLESLALENTAAEITTLPSEPDTTTSLEIFTPLYLRIHKAEMKNNSVILDQVGTPSQTKLSNLGLELNDVQITPEAYSLDLDHGSITYNDSLNVHGLRLDTYLGNERLEVKDLYVDLPQTEVDLNGVVSYPSFQAFVEEGAFDAIDFPELNIHLGTALLNYFTPDSVDLKHPHDIDIVGSITGQKKAIDLPELTVKMAESEVHISIETDGPNWKEKNIKVDYLDANVKRSDLIEYLTYFEIDTTYIPTFLDIDLAGNFDKNTYGIDGNINASSGNIWLDLEGQNEEFIPKTTHLKLRSGKLNGQEILELETPFTFDIDLDAHLDLHKEFPEGNIVMNFDSIHYDKFSVNTTHLNAELLDKQIAVEIHSLDSFLLADVCGFVDLNNQIQAEIEGEIGGADFEGLGFTDKDLRGSFDFDLNLDSDETYQDADLNISDIIFMRDGERVELDTISASVYIGHDSTAAYLHTNTTELESVSNRNISELSNDIANLLAGNELRNQDSLSYWRASFKFHDSPEIRTLVLPKLGSFQPASGRIDYEASSKNVVAIFDIPEIEYDGIRLTDMKFEAIGDSSGMRSTLNLTELSRDSLGIKNLSASAITSQSVTDLKFQIMDDSSQVSYQIEAVLTPDSNSVIQGFDVNLNSPLILNHENWEVDESNRIRYAEEGLDIERFRIQFESDSLEISKDLTSNSLLIKASSFDLDVFSGILNLPDPIFKGELFGTLQINQNGTFSGDGYIEDFEVAHGRFGLFEWETDVTDKNYVVTLKTDGEDIKFDASGDITPQSLTLSDIDLSLNVDKLDMGAMPRIFPTLFLKGAGYLDGGIEIKGTNQNPDLNGELRFNDVQLGLKANGANYTISNQKIDMTTGRIGLDQFTVVDSSGNNLTVNGEITHSYFRDIKTDLTVTSEDFALIDVSQEQNHRLFGKLLAGSSIKIKGRANSPEIEAKIEISDQTDLTYMVPELEYNEQSNEDLIEWTDFQQSADNDILMRAKTDKKKKSYVAKTIDLTGSFFIDEEAVFRVIVDSLAGDYLEIKGGGKLGVSYDRAGNIRINGTYKVTDGFYKMTFYDIVKRTFQFQEGSSLTWNGDPMDATIDITALYRTTTNVANLMASDGNQGSIETFQEQLPFEVLMEVSGDLSRPEIGFGIKLADERRGAYGGAVEAKLNELAQDENELNKQVFALLVLNTFISSSPDADQNLAANQARNSASQILSQQLNALSDDFIKGVDLNFDVQSYGGAVGEGNTDLNIDLAKTFLDDRMIVRVGSTIALESSTPTADEQTVMTNITVEYKLTPDGRYRFKVYQTTDLEDIVVGRITRTGAGVVFQRDFHRFRNVFKSDSNYNPETEPGAEPIEKPEIQGTE